ncbi:MAG: hypothetical protein ACT6FC_02865 [Methanosarcinaceae archaeon]
MSNVIVLLGHRLHIPKISKRAGSVNSDGADRCRFIVIGDGAQV